ncbi:hypothetical protein IW261DRAFT_1496744 [Armillaria novae-zelandiae]|uniref:Uncharacterized protein n=1 Tax=Armillaria novae-zelandiae TaxID=153914 RepID=A0AA39UE37_9AGAR|nr:hypothetical protein IW261DRAFT_1496744 [Armillaria novae-zelandiae]
MSGRSFFNVCNIMMAILVLRMGLSCLLLLDLLRTFCHRLHRLVQTKGTLSATSLFMVSVTRHASFVLRYRPIWIGACSFWHTCSALFE